MNLIDYQKFCLSTAVYPNIGSNWKYCLIGLTGELGEIANKLKKVTRDDHDIITNEKREEVTDEIGDLFWYLMMLCYELKINPELVLLHNKSKLATRQAKNTIHDKGRNE